MMAFSAIACYKSGEFNGSMIIGFTVMILAFSFIVVGIINYRDKFNNGTISFLKALKIGVFISLIASTMYVLSWLVIYYNYFPDYMTRYATKTIHHAKVERKSAKEINEVVAQMNNYKEMYKSPIYVVLLTYMEILPIGLLISLISALLLKRKNKELTPVDVLAS